MKLFIKILPSLVILFIQVLNIYAQIETVQYNCLNALATKYGIFNGLVLTNTGGQESYCDTSVVDCKLNNGVYDVTSGLFNCDDSSNPITYDDIKCLNKLISIDLTSFYISDTIYTTQHPTLKIISIQVPTNFISSGNAVSTLNELSINFGSYSTPITFPITSFLKVPKLTLKGGNLSIVRGSLDISGTLSKIDVTSNTIPELTNIQITDTMSLFIGSNFESSTLGNFQTWNNVNKVELYSILPNMYDFPFGLLSVGSSLKELYTNYNFNTINQLIDLSGLSGLETIQLTGCGSNFYYLNGNSKLFPISNYPTQSIDFTLSGATFDNIPYFSTFTNPGTITLTENSILTSNGIPIYQTFSSKELSIRGNSLSGLLDSTYCAADIYRMDLSDNDLGGSIPECIQCYLGDPVIYNALDGNDFLNFEIPTSPCVSIKPKFQFLNNTHVQLTGTNLGFSSLNIQSEPSFSWQMVTPSSNYIAVYNNPSNYQKVNITFIVPGKSWLFSLDNTIAPIIESVTIIDELVQISGDFFSEDSSVISVTIDSIKCDVSSSTFSKIKCVQGLSLTGTKSLLVLNVNGLTTSVYINLANGVYSTTCQLCASDRGVCNIVSGNCECFANYSGPFCGSQVIPCLNNCNNHGSCNYTTGECSCDYPYFSDDCSSKNCLTSCGGPEVGNCNTTIGECLCKENWTGSGCEKAAIYARTFSSVSEQGGKVEISGWFGLSQMDLIIIIGDLKCDIQTFSSSLVTCNIGSGKGKKFANMTSNGVPWKSNQLVFEYISDNIQCSPTCKNGKCINKICDCSGTTFKGIDCSEPIRNNTPPTGTQVNDNGTSIIYNGNTQYQIYLLSILEVDILGKTVKEFPLSSTWKVIESNTNTGITIFSQKINDNSTQLNFTVEEVSEKQYPNGKSYSFANENFIVSPNSIKIQFSMVNYTYSGSLNSLKLLMQSSVSENNGDECNKGEASTETQEEDSTLTYLSISKDNKKMFGRFLDKAMVDDRSTLISTSIYSKNDSSVIVSINLPHSKNVLLDPDFSVIVTPSFVDSCEDSKKNWVIPVAVVVPVVAISLIIVTTVLILKKNRMTIKLKLNSLNRSMSMRSFKSRD